MKKYFEFINENNNDYVTYIKSIYNDEVKPILQEYIDEYDIHKAPLNRNDESYESPGLYYLSRFTSNSNKKIINITFYAVDRDMGNYYNKGDIKTNFNKKFRNIKDSILNDITYRLNRIGHRVDGSKFNSTKSDSSQYFSYKVIVYDYSIYINIDDNGIN